MDYRCTHIGVQANPWQDLHIMGQTLNLLQYHASGEKKKSLCQKLSSFISTISGTLLGSRLSGSHLAWHLRKKFEKT